MKKKILIAGGSYSDIPLIKEAKKLGYYIITTGNRKEDLGHKFSDEYYLKDFSDKNSILELAKKLNIDYIVPSCHDLSMVTCAYVAEKLGLPGYDSYEITLNLHHKDKFRKISNIINLPTPRYFAYENIDKAKEDVKILPVPSIVKPIDLGGGKGISIVHKTTEFFEAINNAFNTSKSKRIVIEEYINGSLHSFSTFIKDKKVIFSFGDDEFSYVNPFGVSTSTSISKVFLKVKENLIEITEKLVKYLNLKDGLLHMQYLFDGKKVYIVEYTRRMPGDWYNIPVELSTGINYSYWVLQGFLDGDFSELKQKSQNGFYSRHCLIANKNGIIKNIIINKNIKNNIIDSFIWVDKNKKVHNYIYEKFGLFFLKYDSFEEMKEKTEKINELIKLEIE
jgi:biotin carboxylase